MTVSVSSLPTYPVPDKEVKLTFSCTTGNYVRLFLVGCPPESKYFERLGPSGSSSVLIGETPVATEWVTTFDKPGVYSFNLHEITKGASQFGGSFQDDPAADSTETLIGIAGWTISVGQRMSVSIGCSSKGTATLGLWVWSTYIRPTTKDYHGEKTPVITDWNSEAARIASIDATVISNLASLDNTVATTSLGSLGTFVDDLIDKFAAHRVQAGVHAANDTDNALDSSWKVGSSSVAIDRICAALAQVERLLTQHQQNDKGTGVGSATSDYHSTADNKRAVVSDGASDSRTAWLKLADLRRLYTAHIADTGSHATADTTNTLTSASTFLTLYQSFFTQLATTTPTTPTAEQSAAATLVTLGGFSKA